MPVFAVWTSRQIVGVLVVRVRVQCARSVGVPVVGRHIVGVPIVVLYLVFCCCFVPVVDASFRVLGISGYRGCPGCGVPFLGVSRVLLVTALAILTEEVL
jgi:hypothetical protein